MTQRRMRTATALGALAVLSLAGCMKMDMAIELLPEDQVSGTITMAVSREFAELAGESPESLADQMAADMTDTEGATSVPYDDGTYIGSTTTFEAVSIEEWTADSGSETLNVVRDGDEYVVTGELDMTDAGGLEEYGLTVPLDIRIAVTFPGKVSEHNGTLSGTTVEWIPVAGELNEISARGSAVGGGGIPWLIIGVALGALVLVGVVVLLLARRKPATAGASETFGAPVAPTFDPTAYPPPAASYDPTAPAAAPDAPETLAVPADPTFPDAPPAPPVAPENPDLPPAPTAPEDPRV